MKIGFIGLGIMGKPMARNLLKAGYEVVCYDIVAENVANTVAVGAKAAASCKAVAEQCPIVITMLPNSPHVKEAVLGPGGVLEGAKAGTILIDMSSIAPLASQEIAKACGAKGVKVIDAPVSGGEPKAIDGTLSIMVGGDENVFNSVKDILLRMGASAVIAGLSARATPPSWPTRSSSRATLPPAPRPSCSPRRLAWKFRPAPKARLTTKRMRWSSPRKSAIRS